jgi:phosphoglycolate phosphatase-like HAD superfamily hydrolase
VLEGSRHGGEDSIGREGRIAAVDAIVFDWDGTLVDSLPAIFEANLRVLEEYGLPFDDHRYRAAYVPDWRLMYQRLGVPDDSLDAAGNRWLELYREAGAAGLLPRVAESLRRLVDAGFVLGLVTAGHRDVVHDQLERFGISSLLPIRVYGSDDVAAKPHPEPLLRALSQLDRAERVASARYVGDVPDDMRMARAVGAIGIGIESAIGSRAELLAAGAAHVYAGVAEFVDTLLHSALPPAGAGSGQA